MTRPKAPQPGDWQVGLRVWLDRAGQTVLGPGRLQLLAGIDRHKSISAAARQMGMSYRRAWLLVQSINQAAGFPIVAAAVGGTHGGGAQLTEQGQTTVAVFRVVQDRLSQAARSALGVLPAEDDSIHVAAAVSLEEVLNQLLVDYTARYPERRVRAVFGPSDELADQLLRSRNRVELFLSAGREPVDQLTSAGCLEASTLTVLAENGLAALAPPASRHALRHPSDLCKASVHRLALANPSTPLGRYTHAYLQAEGLYERLRARVLNVDNPRGVVSALHAGQADAGLVYLSDVLTATDCRLLFRIPRPPLPIRYWAGLTPVGRNSTGAKDFFAFLSSPQAVKRFRRCGFSPATQGKQS